MKNTSDMKTGSLASVSEDLNVGADRKKSKFVNGADLAEQGESQARSEFMDLENGEVNPIQPSNRDSFQ